MKLIVGNLKMYFDGSEIKNYLDNLIRDDNVVVCPSSIHIPYFLNKNINVGLQDVSMYEKGSFTGEVSALQGVNIGVTYALIGHYETRKYNDNKIINLKIKNALKHNMNVMLCVGETLDEKNNNLTLDVIKKQLNECLDGINGKVIIVYEPIWSIGSGLIPTNEEIKNIINFIKENYNYKVLYGGSVNLQNIDTLNKISNIDGFLVGFSASKVDEFNEIIKEVNKI
ncbi:MAG: triose-phosphate isomerase [Firmicutes bacterium]|nr:triose-phosphate isomerase [Bacillota bacterium]